MVFKAQNGLTKLRLCALNTHMSFKGTARARSDLLKIAMDETKKAACDAVVFVGDFNTRMHCGARNPLKLPAFENNTGGKTSFELMLDHNCVNGRCSLEQDDWD